MSRSPSPDPVFNDSSNSESTASSHEPSTCPSSVEPADNSPASSFLGLVSNDPAALAPSQYQPALKRKASQDLASFAEEQAHLVGLDETTIIEMSNQFAHYSTNQKLIVIRVSQKRQALKFQCVIKAAQGPPAVQSAFQVSFYSFSSVANSVPSTGKDQESCFLALPVYLADNKPIQLVLGFLSKYPGWGYTKAAAADPDQNALIRTLVRDTLTNIHSEFKAVIAKASGFNSKGEVCDIEVLCKRILASRTGKHGCKLTQPNLQMVACFVILRKVYVREKSQIKGGDSDFRKYWKAVDKTLTEEIPEVAKGLSWTVSRLISRTLSLDCKNYPWGGDCLPGVDASYETYSPKAQLDAEEVTAGCFGG